jgi:hypothetical protein
MKSGGDTTQARNLRTGLPVWLARRERDAPDHLPIHALTVDVAVIGGGVSGALVADAMLQAGQSVANKLAIFQGCCHAGRRPVTTSSTLPSALNEQGSKFGVR